MTLYRSSVKFPTIQNQVYVFKTSPHCLAHGEAFIAITEEFANLRGLHPPLVAGIEARGFIFRFGGGKSIAQWLRSDPQSRKTSAS